jgi:hypothetical protein
MAETTSSLTPTGAIVAYLDADATLAALATGGVWTDPAPEAATPITSGAVAPVFVTVGLLSDRPQWCSGGLGFHDALYTVQAVGPSDRLRDIEAAALRIFELLTRPDSEGRDIDGWDIGGLRLEAVVEFPDPEVATGIRWEHRGGQYRVLATSTHAVASSSVSASFSPSASTSPSA